MQFGGGGNHAIHFSSTFHNTLIDPYCNTYHLTDFKKHIFLAS